MAIASVVSVARALVPTEVAAIELKVRLLYALNERYRELMGLDPSLTRGNRLYRWSHADLDPLLNRATELLSLTAEERTKLLASRASSAASAESQHCKSDSGKCKIAHRSLDMCYEVRKRIGFSRTCSSKCPRP